MGFRYLAAGAAVGNARRTADVAGSIDADSGATFAPTSLRSRWNSGDAMMIAPAAVRKRSTASAGSTKLVGRPFR